MKLRELRVDGYKNLSECSIPLRDFNIVVGPNNSGKSNLLEVFQIIKYLCFGSQHEREGFLWGLDDLRHNRPGVRFWTHVRPKLSVGVTFDTVVNGEPWAVDYDVVLHRSPKAESRGFEEERLKGKPQSRRGPATTYLRRDGGGLVLLGRRKHPIQGTTSAISAVSVLYPEVEGLSPELATFLRDIDILGQTVTYALSPEAIRSSLDRESRAGASRVSSLGLLPALDKLFQCKAKRELFRETVCSILDLDDLRFDVLVPASKAAEADQGRGDLRVRMCTIRTGAGEFPDLTQFSDGTLIVLSLVAAIVLEDKTSGITCIEELENCLHPRAQERLLRFLKSNSDRWQLLITTHSPYLVNGADPDDLLVAVAKPDGSRFLKPGDQKSVEELLKRGRMSFGDLMANNFHDLLKA